MIYLDPFMGARAEIIGQVENFAFRTIAHEVVVISSNLKARHKARHESQRIARQEAEKSKLEDFSSGDSGFRAVERKGVIIFEPIEFPGTFPSRPSQTH